MIFALLLFLTKLFQPRLRLAEYKFYVVIRLVDSGFKLRDELFDYLTIIFKKRLKFEVIYERIFYILMSLSVLYLIPACIVLFALNRVYVNLSDSLSMFLVSNCGLSIGFLVSSSIFMFVFKKYGVIRERWEYFLREVEIYRDKSKSLPEDNFYDNRFKNPDHEMQFLLNEKVRLKTVWYSVKYNINASVYPWMHLRLSFLKKSKTRKMDVYLALLFCDDGLWKLRKIELKPEMFHYEYRRSVLGKKIKLSKRKFTLANNYKQDYDF
ncbi:hypothetical protein U5U50_00690 [Mycoplasma sp. 888]|uniref:hypothetical protein n=1 Tax=Mycoplasma sp. 888 TaxID=3108483 RepID=UPI002D7928E6|nr:hypothetical protein [Mycoplasma sp. 888]WRQ25907.1 hypothetical protein U5U50_00690 [Mycoplasma sp. 888]